MAKDVILERCPTCRGPSWRLKFWRWGKHCPMCHSKRQLDQYDIDHASDPKNSARRMCIICTPRARIN